MTRTKHRFSFLKAIIAGNRALLLAAAIFAATAVFAQSRTDLERQKAKKLEEIRFTQRMLAEKKEKQKESLSYLSSLKIQIKQREELLGTYQNELHLINLDIEENTDLVEAMHRDILQIKDEYARMVYHSYKNQTGYRTLAFIFSAGSFNEAWNRIQFIRFYSEFRKKQINLLERTQVSLNARLADLQKQQLEKKAVIGNIDTEKRSYEKDKTEQNNVLSKLKKEEKKLRQDLSQKKKAANNLDKAIKDIIAKEIAKDQRKAAAKGPNAPGATPEALKLSAEFANNRAKLPWPVERGVISGHFGQQAHPTLPNVTIENKGIKIRSTQGAVARAVFGGEVTAIVKIPGSGKAVIVRHGEYRTVYCYLDNTYVKVGDKVTTKQALGTVARDTESGDTEIELQIWKGSEKLNPAGWLARQ
ncbi:MAG: peptidoglycan DD-metalloendopeptidase family protein [Bacteroidota bacterium]|nr:peptidoglycan DD-metalloendopeptidase family protein [Bacteroidota bacterium]